MWGDGPRVLIIFYGVTSCYFHLEWDYLPRSLKFGFPDFSKLALVQKSRSPGQDDKPSPGEEALALPTPLTSLLLVTPKLQRHAHPLEFPAPPPHAKPSPSLPTLEALPPEGNCGASRVRTPSPVSQQGAPPLSRERPGGEGGALSPKMGCVSFIRSQPLSPAS